MPDNDSLQKLIETLDTALVVLYSGGKGYVTSDSEYVQWYNDAQDALASLESALGEKTVPLAMLREIMDMTIREGGSMNRAYAIANAHGYTVK